MSSLQQALSKIFVVLVIGVLTASPSSCVGEPEVIVDPPPLPNDTTDLTGPQDDETSGDETARLRDEIGVLKKQLENERNARQAAERKLKEAEAGNKRVRSELNRLKTGAGPEKNIAVKAAKAVKEAELAKESRAAASDSKQKYDEAERTVTAAQDTAKKAGADYRKASAEADKRINNDPGSETTRNAIARRDKAYNAMVKSREDLRRAEDRSRRAKVASQNAAKDYSVKSEQAFKSADDAARAAEGRAGELRRAANERKQEAAAAAQAWKQIANGGSAPVSPRRQPAKPVSPKKTSPAGTPKGGPGGFAPPLSSHGAENSF